MRKKKPLPLSRLELDIMHVVWELGDCTSAQVTSAFNKKRPLAPTTIRTVLANLRNKGYIKPIPSLERGFLMRPTIQREAIARHSLQEVVSSFFGNSPKQAIAYLLNEGELTDQEMDEIRQLFEQHRKRGRK